MPSLIQDYGLVGDGETCALIARDGSVDFLCWPQFDSDACFCALLGDERNGRWQIAPEEHPTQARRRYRGDTLILETEFETVSGMVRLTDFMPRRGQHSSLVRIVEGVRGQVPMRLDLRLRFDYGFMPPWVRSNGDCLIADVGPDLVAFRAPVPVETSDADAMATARFTVGAGRRLAFTLTYGNSSEPTPPRPDVEAVLADTVKFWEDWIGRFDKPCHWPATVKRSLITLRALIDIKTGGLVAAPTLGLPEVPGGSMNWDYRYCWLRDATFTLTALLNAGYKKEAMQWRDWILRAIAGKPDTMQIVYRLDGGRRLSEWPVQWLQGYQGSKPVLVGNEAAGQLQLGVYGELLDSMHVSEHMAGSGAPRAASRWRRRSSTTSNRFGTSRARTSGNRAVTRTATPSRRRCAWVGITQFLKGSRAASLAVDDDATRRLEALREQDPRARSASRATTPGAAISWTITGTTRWTPRCSSCPSSSFLPADDPRIAGTIAAIERELMDGGLVRRKPAKHDGHDEGRFPRVLVLARRLHGEAGTARRGADDAGAGDRAVERRRPAQRGIPRADAATDRQHAAGADPSRRGQHRALPLRPGAAARRMTGARRMGAWQIRRLDRISRS